MTSFIWTLLTYFMAAMGLFWLILKMLEFFFPSILPWLNWRWTFSGIVVTSLLYAAIRVWPWRPIRLPIAGTDAHITIRFDDILKSEGNIAIASSNFFNTDLSFISKSSLLGQYILKYFNGGTARIEEGISRSLQHITPEKVIVSRGKPLSYPIGTVAMFDGPKNNKVFLLAITEILEEDNEEKITSSASNVQKALETLWDRAEQNINDGILNMVPLGSGISHSFHRLVESVMFIALSFVKRCKIRRPCSELVIFIRKSDVKLKDYGALKQIIEAITG
ncbi:macro domain-containing protein [Desulfomonile tiedjei]|uniref:Thoeris protein ThsA Macro domain-containing protein n=1 Tax=Desulfomonile tiedjei (strain ATCC 49306 / DSM 6799 / DCB-1) TaxID=706587 RepID=I4CAN7_DESTA|nr:macro domain-containing protein [Desulfomonile tiedjei]AFM26628.1 hypothetical protein Desti_3986 [Desulfomonile tiedjei DSM 6799]